MTSLVAAKRAHPDGGLPSALITALDSDDSLSEAELVSLAVLLLIAGHETTTSLIGNAVLAMLRHPDQLDQLRRNSDLIPGALDELLRYDSPTSVATIRFTSEPVTIAGVTIPADQVVLISPAAANHDPSRFPAPDVLDLSRGDAASHLAFGHGIHYCLGARLARAEAEIALATLLSRFPDLHLAATPDDLDWRHSRLVHGLRSLPVSLRP
jgi:cytochrome P450